MENTGGKTALGRRFWHLEHQHPGLSTPASSLEIKLGNALVLTQLFYSCPTHLQQLRLTVRERGWKLARHTHRDCPWALPPNLTCSTACYKNIGNWRTLFKVWIRACLQNAHSFLPLLHMGFWGTTCPGYRVYMKIEKVSEKEWIFLIYLTREGAPTLPEPWVHKSSQACLPMMTRQAVSNSSYKL